jgi:protein-disulfide isomerase
MRLRSAILDVLTGAAALSAIAMVALTLHQGTGVSQQRRSSPEPRKIANADSYSRSGHRIGPRGARFTIVEFGDFQCPACGAFYQTMKKMQAGHPADIAIVFRHYPLSYHRQAYAAARAAECAGRQGKFDEMYNALYTQQAALATKTFADFAIDAHVSDTASFNQCVSQTDQVPAIDDDVEAARKLGVSATPGILINDLLYTGALTETTLEGLLKRQLGTHN